MRATLVVARGASVVVLPPNGPPREVPLAAELADAGAGRGATTLPPGLLEDLVRLPASEEIVACGELLARGLERHLRRPIGRANAAAWRHALADLPPVEPSLERRQFLARAHRRVEETLRSPEEVLISLAREEERLERSVGREARAAEAFVAVPDTVLAEVAVAWQEARHRLAEHHRELMGRLEGEALRTAPNLAAVLGPRTASRLVAAAGGLAPLARMSASRLQLLGSRRRPSAERGPRYGLVFRADGMEQLPLDRRGRFARSVAALAVVAARADAFTHADVSGPLVRRRDVRREQLRRRRT